MFTILAFVCFFVGLYEVTSANPPVNVPAPNGDLVVVEPRFRRGLVLLALVPGSIYLECVGAWGNHRPSFHLIVVVYAATLLICAWKRMWGIKIFKRSTTKLTNRAFNRKINWLTVISASILGIFLLDLFVWRNVTEALILIGLYLPVYIIVRIYWANLYKKL